MAAIGVSYSCMRPFHDKTNVRIGKVSKLSEPNFTPNNHDLLRYCCISQFDDITIVTKAGFWILWYVRTDRIATKIRMLHLKCGHATDDRIEHYSDPPPPKKKRKKEIRNSKMNKTWLLQELQSWKRWKVRLVSIGLDQVDWARKCARSIWLILVR